MFSSASVICSAAAHRVVSFNVSRMGLQGTITPFLSNLSFIRMLELWTNCFHSHIPYQLGSLFHLNMLGFFVNPLQGSRAMHYANLQHQKLYENKLTGTISNCLGNMSWFLQYIDLFRNNLHGLVPSEIGEHHGSLLIYVITISHDQLLIPCLTTPSFYNWM